MKYEKGEIIIAFIIGVAILVSTTILIHKTQGQLNKADWTAQQGKLPFQTCDWPHVCLKGG